MLKFAPTAVTAREGGHPAGTSKPEAGSSPAAPPAKRVSDVVKFRKPLPDAPKAERGRPASGTKLITLRLSPEVIDKFRATGKGWQARINEALKEVIL